MSSHNHNDINNASGESLRRKAVQFMAHDDAVEVEESQIGGASFASSAAASVPLKKRAYHHGASSSPDFSTPHMGASSFYAFLSQSANHSNHQNDAEDADSSSGYSSSDSAGRGESTDDSDYGYDGGSSDTSQMSSLSDEDSESKHTKNPANIKKSRKSSHKRKNYDGEDRDNYSSDDEEESSYKRPRAFKKMKTSNEEKNNGQRGIPRYNKSSEDDGFNEMPVQRKVRFVSSFSRHNQATEAAAAATATATVTAASTAAAATTTATALATSAVAMDGFETKKGSFLNIDTKVGMGDSIVSSLTSEATDFTDFSGGVPLTAAASNICNARKPSPNTTRESSPGSPSCERETRRAPWYCYVDHSKIPHSPPSPLVQPCSMPSFPIKLHCILLQEEFQNCVKFLPHGRSWRITDPYSFEEQILPLYFGPTKMSSFMRQVNVWGFKRVSTGRSKNSYYHEQFLKGLPHLCQGMKPQRSSSHSGCKNSKESSRANQPILEPDLFEISQECPLPEGNKEDLECLRTIHKLIVRDGPKAKMPLDIFIGNDVRVAKSPEKESSKMKQPPELFDTKPYPLAAAATTLPIEMKSKVESKPSPIYRQQHVTDEKPKPTTREVSHQDFPALVSSMRSSLTTSSSYSSLFPNHPKPQDLRNSVYSAFPGQRNLATQEVIQSLSMLETKPFHQGMASAIAQGSLQDNATRGSPTIPTLRNACPHSSNNPSGVSSPVDLQGLVQSLLANQQHNYQQQHQHVHQQVHQQQHQQVHQQQVKINNVNSNFDNNQCKNFINATSLNNNLLSLLTRGSPSVTASQPTFNPLASPHQNATLPPPQNMSAQQSVSSGCSTKDSILQDAPQKANGIIESLMQTYREKEAAAAAARSARSQQNNFLAELNQNTSSSSQSPHVVLPQTPPQQPSISPDALRTMIAWAVKEGAKYGAEQYRSNHRNNKS